MFRETGQGKDILETIFAVFHYTRETVKNMLSEICMHQKGPTCRNEKNPVKASIVQYPRQCVDI